MKSFFAVILAIACVTVLFLGNKHWNEQTMIAKEVTSTKADATIGTKKSDKHKGNNLSLIEQTKNWPEKARDRFTTTLAEEVPFKMLVVGSPALGTETKGLETFIHSPVKKAFGAKNIELDINTYDMTSKEFNEEDMAQEIISKNADLLLLEPFTLKDNGMVTIEDSLFNLTALIATLKADNPDLSIILMPPHPLYKAKFYPIQVTALKEYAESKQIPYLDHWSKWPDLESDDMTNYLSPDNSTPNEEGYNLWSAFILKFLINQ